MADSTRQKRLFTGIPLPAFFTDTLQEVQAANKHINKIWWTPPQNLHVTLHFFGNTHETEIAGIIHQLQNVAREIKPFTLLSHHYQLAPKKRPYMIWATFLSNPAFVQLSKAIGTIFQPENTLRKPLAHITLARFKYLKNPSQIVLPSAINTSEITVNRMTLWASELKPDGPEYTTLYTFDLGKE
jgi:2'-5' RNA ligase